MVKRIILGLLALLGFGVAGTSIYFYGVLPKSRAPLDVKAQTTPEAIERGRYLANHVLGCVGCHSPLDKKQPGQPLEEGAALGSGNVFGADDGLPGRLAGSNLTPANIGDWTDGELLRAIREGISRDGRALFPMMEYGAYARWPRSDLLAVISYLRTLPSSDNDVGLTTIDFPVSMFIRAAPAPVETEPGPLPTEPLAYGNLLLESMGCKSCHTPMDKGSFVEGMEFAGGNPFPGITKTVLSANISSDKAAGIGSYTDEQLDQAIRGGVRPDGHKLEGMPTVWYRGMSDSDLKAVITALRATKPNASIPGA